MDGKMLSHYRLVEKIGEGGMGEVYRAHDTRLGRDVAIKLLSPRLAATAEARARFEREARTISQLNHPHICTLHDVGEHDGSMFLVMEHLEGETLGHRLQKGPLPLAQALSVATEIADALAAAHRQGFVHRDLKPGNVMLTRTGAKLLDFGLARLKGHGEQPAAGHLESASTQSLPLTGEGMIVGTLQYMAPEQLEGKPADARTDLWALGAVVYEMVTGKRAFEGASAASLMGAILERQPAPLSRLQPLTPPALERLVGRCLAKAPDDRWDSAHDLADELRWIAQTSLQGTTSEMQTRLGAGPSFHERRLGRRIGIALTAIVGVLLGGSAVWLLRPDADRLPVRHVLLSIAPAERLGPRAWTAGGTRTSIALSPDGRHLVYTGEAEDSLGLYLRALEEDSAQRLIGTEQGWNPVFSPDGRWIAYWTNGEIKKVFVGGGPAMQVCTTGSATAPPYGISWGDDGSLVYAIETGGLWRVSSEGGTPELVTQLQSGEISHRLPHLLPGSRTVMFTSRSTAFVWGHEQIVIESLENHERRVILDHGADARFVTSGHLVFMDLGRLAAVPFDLARLTVTGPPVALVADVAQAVNERNTNRDSGAGQFSVSDSGDLVYVTSPGGIVPLDRETLAWVDRQGVVSPVPMVEKDIRSPKLAPDGRRVVVAVHETSRMDAWLFDLVRGTWSRLTDDGEIWRSVWSPDGQELMLATGSGSTLRRSLVAAGPSGEVLADLSGLGLLNLSSWSRGGVLAYVQGPDYARFDISILDLNDHKRVLRPFVNSGAAETCPEFSPDGRWLAYMSQETGRSEVYVLPYPGPGERVQVSTEGGDNPLWGPNGRELFYAARISGKWWMHVADIVQKDGTLEVGRARALFEWPADLYLGASLNAYSVSPDGQRFLAAKSVAPPPSPTVTHINLVQNWVEELKTKVPVRR